MAQTIVTTLTTSSTANTASPWVTQADNGNLWCMQADRLNSRLRFFYSTDKGVNWSEDTGADFGASFPNQTAIYILGDKVWVVWDDVYGPSDNYVLIQSGTLNAARTAISSWVDAEYLWSTASADYPRTQALTVHAEGTGYQAHVLFTNYYYGDNRYARVSFNSSNVITSWTSSTWSMSGIAGTNGEGRILHDPATKDIFMSVVTRTGADTYELWFQKRAYTSATWPAGTTRVLGTSPEDQHPDHHGARQSRHYNDRSHTSYGNFRLDGFQHETCYADQRQQGRPHHLERHRW